MRKRININKYRDYCENKQTQNRGELFLSVCLHVMPAVTPAFNTYLKKNRHSRSKLKITDTVAWG